MGKCGKCGREMGEKAKYCKSCGSALARSGSSLDGKKARVMGPERNWVKPAALAAVIVLLAAGGWMFKVSGARQSGNQPMFPPQRHEAARVDKAVAVSAIGADVVIPVENMTDGKARFFSYITGGKTVTFFIMKALDGSIQTAFDACVACNDAKLGYRQEGGLVVCNNCGMGFRPDDIGRQAGGCSPIPIEKTVNGQTVVLKAKELDAGARYF